MKDDLDLCLVLNTRMAARAVTRRADHKLRPLGITAAQFTILGALSTSPVRSITDMANVLAMDRTTLSRNMTVLERLGLVASGPGESARIRQPGLTEAGRQIFEKAMPEWRRSQAEMRDALADPDFETTIQGLRHLSRL